MSPSDDPEFSLQVPRSILALVLGVLVGTAFIVYSLYLDANLCHLKNQLLFCIGVGVLLGGFGGWISGTWKNWSVAGAGGIALGFFTILFLLHDCFPDNSQGQVQLPEPVPRTSPDPVTSMSSGSTPSATQQPVGSPLLESSPSPPTESVPRAPLDLAPSTSPEQELSVSPESLPTPLQEPTPSPSPEQSRLSEPRLQQDGWVYIGTNVGRHWDEKYFNWDGDSERLPEGGDILTSTGSVNLRVRLGRHAHIVGVICPEEKVKALGTTKTLRNTYHWVKVKRIKEKQGNSQST